MYFITFGLILILNICRVFAGEEATFQTPTPDTSFSSMYLTQEFMKVEASYYLSDFEAAVISSHIPDYHDKIKTSTGSADLSLTNIQITDFHIDSMAIDFDDNNQVLNGELFDGVFKIIFDYGYQQLNFPYLSEEGTGKVSSTGLSISTILDSYRVPETGHLIIDIEYLNFDIGDLDIEMDGDLLANIIKILESIFSDAINDMLSAAISDYMVSVIDPALKRLENLTMSFCSPSICQDARLGEDPSMNNNAIRFNIGGTFFIRGQQNLYVPPDHSEELQILNDDHSVQFQFSQASLESYLISVGEINYLNSEHSFISGDDDSSILSYDSLVKYFPQWASSYPSGTNGTIYFKLNGNPSLEIMYTGLRITGDYEISVVPIGLQDTTHISSKVNIVMLGDYYWRDYHGISGSIETNPSVTTIEASYVSSSDSGNVFTGEWIAEATKRYLIPTINSNFVNEYIRIYQRSGLVYLDPVVEYSGNYVLLAANNYINV